MKSYGRELVYTFPALVLLDQGMLQVMMPMDTVHVLTLRTRDGRERTELVWLPTPEVREDFYEKARRCGIDIIEQLKDD